MRSGAPVRLVAMLILALVAVSAVLLLRAHGSQKPARRVVVPPRTMNTGLPADPLLSGPPAGSLPLLWHQSAVYAHGALAAGWQDWSWTEHHVVDVQTMAPAGPALSVSHIAWGGIYLHSAQDVNLWDGSVTIMLSGGDSGGQQLQVMFAQPTGGYSKPVLLSRWLPEGLMAHQWTTITMPLHPSLAAGSGLGGIVLQDAGGTAGPPFLVREILLREAPWPDYPIGSVPVAVQIDASAPQHEISPFIYGMAADGSAAAVRAMRPTVARWGGNPSSLYNWKLGNAWKTGSDYLFENVNYGNIHGSLADTFAQHAKAAGAALWLPVPTIGWVAKDTTSVSFPDSKGLPTNGQGSSCLSPRVTPDPTRTSIPVTPSFIQDWLRHLAAVTGSDSPFISMDNEPDLWGVTHYDVHPACTSYDEIFQEFTRYATAVKVAAPRSLVTGPALCCWKDYWDSMVGPSDRLKHGGQQFLPWFLSSVRGYDQTLDRCTLDVLDLHYYPTGVYNQIADPATSAWRLQETRSLWDPTYNDYSYIAEPVQLIPRIDTLIGRDYPGTKFGIGEWNFGAESSPGGGLAVADVLGIFGQQGLYMAAYFQYPPAGSPAATAFQFLGFHAPTADFFDALASGCACT